MSTSEQQLRAGAEALGIEVSENEFTALLNYLALLQKWNKAYNLTAIRDESGMVALHLLDSLAVHPAVQDADNIIDVGTGPGLPGIVLAIMNPQKRFTLLDSNGNRFSLGTPFDLRSDYYTPLRPRTLRIGIDFAF